MKDENLWISSFRPNICPLPVPSSSLYYWKSMMLNICIYSPSDSVGYWHECMEQKGRRLESLRLKAVKVENLVVSWSKWRYSLMKGRNSQLSDTSFKFNLWDVFWKRFLLCEANGCITNWIRPSVRNFALRDFVWHFDNPSCDFNLWDVFWKRFSWRSEGLPKKSNRLRRSEVTVELRSNGFLWTSWQSLMRF